LTNYNRLFSSNSIVIDQFLKVQGLLHLLQTGANT